MPSITHDGITYTFSMLTLKHEDEWRDWVRAETMAEAVKSSEYMPEALRIKYLAECKAGVAGVLATFISEAGLKYLGDAKGMAKVLSMACTMDAPKPDEAALRALIDARPDECEDLVLELVPTTAQRRLFLQKKVKEMRAKEQAELT